MYTQLLTQIKNAQLVGKERVKAPHSRMDEAILSILEQQRFIKSFEKKGKSPKRYFDIVLKYSPEGEGAIKGFSFVSKPSRRIYKGYTSLRLIRHGFGMGVLSTSSGIMTDKEAKSKKVGGQVLFTIW